MIMARRHPRRDGAPFLKIAGLALVVVFCIWLAMSNRKSDKEEIQTWADDNKIVKVVSIEEPLFSTGPFWIREDHHRIYKVIVIDNSEKQRTTWFRFGGWFGYDQEWE